MPIVREFCRKTKASSFPTPRKRRFETGSGKYRSHWLTADYAKENNGVTAFAYEFAKTLNRPGIPQGFITMSSGSVGRNGQLSSPLSWTSYKGVKSIKNLEFKTRLDELFLQFPGSDIEISALSKHINEVRNFTQIISSALESNADYSEFPLQAPSFPEAGKSESVRSDTIPTYTYNWCVSPLTPMDVSGVLWVPSESNIGEESSDYATELEIYAKSLPETYGQQEVPFLYAHPKKSLVENIKLPKIDGAKVTYFDQWPKSIKAIAVELAKQIK